MRREKRHANHDSHKQKTGTVSESGQIRLWKGLDTPSVENVKVVRWKETVAAFQ